MRSDRATTITTWTLLAGVAVTSFLLPDTLTVPATIASPPPDSVRIMGVVRDFWAAHPDFAITGPTSSGHYAWNVGPVLSHLGRPMFAGGGARVVTEWVDKDGNPIMPYASDPGLPGGHFDVDVYDELSDNELYHKHEFDDSFDLTYIDIVNDSNLLFDTVIGPAYPNDLTVQFINPHNGWGGYQFKAGATELSGINQDGFSATFDPNTLTEFRVDFTSLFGLRATSPGDAQSDPADRNDSFAVRMFDTVTSAMVYEVTVYHHGDPADVEIEAGSAASGNDACGVSLDDTVGDFGNFGTGAVTSANTFEQWFTDELGVNLSQSYAIRLQNDGYGVYEYLTNAFFPVDERLFGNENLSHNYFFTYTFLASFTYDQCTNQFFEFEGNDDCWVFIDSKRAIDLGGVGTTMRQYVALDRLELVDGESYDLAFFFAHRRSVANSVFRLRTNILLSTPDTPMTSAAFD